MLPPPKQRKMPSVSGLQQLNLGGGQSQQASRSLPPHVFSTLPKRRRPQTAPRGWQPVAFRQTPVGGLVPAAISHVTLPGSSVCAVGSPPQQSLFFWQVAFVMRQPLAGWQILTPVAAYGAHWRLQQFVQSVHTTPSWMQLPAPPTGSFWHVPAVWPWGITQFAVQQSLDR
jgi:hypothetical protein